MATLWIFLQLGQNYSLSLGSKVGFVVGTKIVSFRGLRFLSSMRSEVLGSLQIETVFYVMLQYRLRHVCDTSLHVVIQMKASKLFLVVIAVFFDSNTRGQTFIFLHAPSVFVPKRLRPFRRFYWRNVFPRISYFHAFPRRPPFHADLWGKILPFPPQTKNNLGGIDISQPTPSISLSVPSFSLGLWGWANPIRRVCACSCSDRASQG